MATAAANSEKLESSRRRSEEKAARLARLYRLKIPDAAIAATAADCAMPLVSRDRGFRKVKEVSLVEV